MIRNDDRNESIFNEYLNGKSYKSLANEYNISASRIRDICNNERILTKFKVYPISQSIKTKHTLIRLINNDIKSIEDLQHYVNSCNYTCGFCKGAFRSICETANVDYSKRIKDGKDKSIKL